MRYDFYLTGLNGTDRYLALRLPQMWSIVDLHERAIIHRVTCQELPIEVPSHDWTFDPVRKRVFSRTDLTQLECRELGTDQLVWSAVRKESEVPEVNLRTGHLLLTDYGSRWLNGATGEVEPSLWTREKAELAVSHPSLPLTVFIRRGESDMSVAPWKRRTTYHVDLFDEQTGQIREVCVQLKERPKDLFLVGPYVVFAEYGGIVHCINAISAKLCWSKDIKDKWFGAQDFRFDSVRSRLVLRVNMDLLLLDAESGEEQGHRPIPNGWGEHGIVDCMVNDGRHLLLLDGRMFDVETMECVEEGVFASMGLFFGPPD